MGKANKILKIVTSAALCAASVLMIVFAILNLAGSGPKESPTLPIRVILSVILIVSSVILTWLVVAKDPHHFDSRLVIYNGLLLGTGIFVAHKVAGEVADTIVGYFVPCILVGIGVFFIIATIISLINKVNSRSTDIVALILGLIILVIGIVLLAFAEKAKDVTWLMIGVILFVNSILALVQAIKGDKIKTLDTTKEDSASADTSKDN